MSNRTTTRFFKCILSSLLIVAASALAEPVAIVTDVQGSAKLELAGESSEVSILDNLEVESNIEVGKDNTITLVYYDSGIEYSYTGPAAFVINNAEPALLTGNDGKAKELKALENTGLKPSDNVVQAATVFRSAGDLNRKIKLLSPVNTITIETSPEFSWEPVGGNASYQFLLRSTRGQTVYEQSVEANTLRLPADSLLQNGRKYTWEVSSSSGDELFRGVASFQVGTESSIQSLRASEPASDATFSEKVVYALLLKQQGFSDAATKKWQELEKMRPDQAKADLFD